MRTKLTFLKLIFFFFASLSITMVFAEQQKPEEQLNTEEATPPSEPNTISELKDAIEKLMEEKEVPAVGIAMINESGPQWIGALGKANIEKDIAADENSLFRIGSTSKMFVALSVLKLVEQGKLSLSDKVSELAPEIEFKNQWHETDPVRLVHLLEHTTGWDDLHLNEYAHNDPTPASLKEGLDFHPHSRISRWKPGSRMSYCNSGPPVAAYIVEKITGQKFEDYVQQNFFDPMGMNTATYLLNDNVKNQGVTLYNNGNEPQSYWHIIMRPSGSINASAIDMSQFLQFYLNRGKVGDRQLISPSSLDRMERAESTNAAKVGLQSGYGLHNYTSDHENWVYREHNGGVNGGITEFAYLPNENIGHAIMMNSGDYSTFKEISKLVRNYETRNLKTLIVSNEHQVNAEHKTIEGLYFPINSRQKMSFFIDRIANVHKLWFDGNELLLKPILGGEAETYYPESKTLYKAKSTGVISLAVATDPIAGLVVHANNTVLKPTSAIAAYSKLAIAILWLVLMGSALLYFIVWGIRKLRGKVPSGATIKIRMWPLLASASIALLMILFIVGVSDPFELLGKPSLVSVLIMLSTITFALFSVLGVYTAFKERSPTMNQVNYWYCAVSSGVNILVMLYLLWFSVIGLMTWA